MSRFKTVREATEAWVHEMNAIPQGMISQLFQDHSEDWTEVTTPSKYDRVYVYENGDLKFKNLYSLSESAQGRVLKKIV